MAMTEATLAVNRAQPGRVIAMLEQAVGSLAGKKVLVLGLAFKPGTDDVRDSPSIPIVELLLKKGAVVSAHDPMAGKNFLRASGERAVGVVLVKDWRAAAGEAEAIVIATKWTEYQILAAVDLSHKTVFDARRMLQPNTLRTARYLGVGCQLVPIDEQ
jgi:UDPglucose 6-dehydrogenase